MGSSNTTHNSACSGRTLYETGSVADSNLQSPTYEQGEDAPVNGPVSPRRRAMFHQRAAPPVLLETKPLRDPFGLAKTAPTRPTRPAHQTLRKAQSVKMAAVSEKDVADGERSKSGA